MVPCIVRRHWQASIKCRNAWDACTDGKEVDQSKEVEHRCTTRARAFPCRCLSSLQQNYTAGQYTNKRTGTASNGCTQQHREWPPLSLIAVIKDAQDADGYQPNEGPIHGAGVDSVTQALAVIVEGTKSWCWGFHICMTLRPA